APAPNGARKTRAPGERRRGPGNGRSSRSGPGRGAVLRGHLRRLGRTDVLEAHPAGAAARFVGDPVVGADVAESMGAPEEALFGAGVRRVGSGLGFQLPPSQVAAEPSGRSQGAQAYT